MFRILFVCHGNICRSPMAEFVMKHLVSNRNLAADFYIESAATSTEEIGNDIHHGTKNKLTQVGIAFQKRHARQITKHDYDFFDYIIVMDSKNIRNIKRIIDDKEHKIYKLLEFADRNDDIADPWYTGNFDTTYNDILEGCTCLLNSLSCN